MNVSDVEIMEVALNLFAQKGYTSVSTREIAQTAGITEMTLFRKFESKKKLFMRSIMHECSDDDIGKALERIPCDDPKQAFRELSRLIYESFQNQSRVLKISAGCPEVKDPEFIEMSTNKINAFQGHIGRFIERIAEGNRKGRTDGNPSAAGKGGVATGYDASLSTMHLTAQIMGVFFMKEVARIEPTVAWNIVLDDIMERFSTVLV